MINNIKELSKFTPVIWTDHEFATFLRKKDKNWTWEKAATLYNRFLCNNKIVAIVKYKNDSPIDRWIWILTSELPTI